MLCLCFCCYPHTVSGPLLILPAVICLSLFLTVSAHPVILPTHSRWLKSAAQKMCASSVIPFQHTLATRRLSSSCRGRCGTRLWRVFFPALGGFNGTYSLADRFHWCSSVGSFPPRPHISHNRRSVICSRSFEPGYPLRCCLSLHSPSISGSRAPCGPGSPSSR